MAILGISTNTRLLGQAIIEQGNLLDYSIRLHKSPWSASKANKIIAGLEPCVRQYCIKSVVLSIPYAHHQTKEFRQLVACIKKYFEKKKISICSKAVQSLHSLYPAEQKKTKKALMEYLTTQYPQLTYCYYRELKNRKKYYIKIFEAVGAAILYYKEQMR